MKKITSNGGVKDKKKKLAMTRDIESSNSLGNATLFFKLKNNRWIYNPNGGYKYHVFFYQ